MPKAAFTFIRKPSTTFSDRFTYETRAREGTILLKPSHYAVGGWGFAVYLDGTHVADMRRLADARRYVDQNYTPITA